MSSGGGAEGTYMWNKNLNSYGRINGDYQRYFQVEGAFGGSALIKPRTDGEPVKEGESK